LEGPPVRLDVTGRVRYHYENGESPRSPVSVNWLSPGLPLVHMYRLNLFGGASLEGPSGPLSGSAAQPRRLAVLAVLAVCGSSGCSRDKLIGLLWPDSDENRGRHHLSQSLYVLRQALGEGAIDSAAESVRLVSTVVATDAWAFEDAIDRGDLESAVRHYTGPFLDGFYLREVPTFEEWADGERQRLARRYAEALESLALGSEDTGDHRSAVGWWERLLAHDPYNSRTVVRLMRTLAANGDPANAIQCARAHEQLLADEFEMELPAEVSALVEELRRPETPEASGSPPEAGVLRRPQVGTPLAPAGASRADPVARPRSRAVFRVALAALVVASVLGWLWMTGRADETGTTAPFESVAVIPFMNLTGEVEFDLFADGLADELISVLSRVPDLKVPAQTSSFHFRGSDLTASAIGDALGVQAIFEGSVRKEGSRVRVNVQLIDTEDGYHAWTETYDREIASWLDLQVEIAYAVLRALNLEIPEGWSPLRPQTQELTAWQDYQKARHWWIKRTQEGSDTAIVYFRRAIERDSTYARAWSGLANAYITAVFWGRLPASDSLRLAMWGMAERSLELDPTLAEAVTTRAGLLFDDGEMEASEKEFLRAIELNPNYVLAHQWYADLLSRVERKEQALEEARLAYELDPMSHIVNKILGDILRGNLLLEEAIEYWNFAIDLEPDHWSSHANKSRALACLGRFEESQEANRRDIEIRGESDHAARNLYLMRDYEGALAMIERLREENPTASAELASKVHAELGNWDQAVEEYRTEANKYPGDAYTALSLAYIYARTGEEVRARAIVEAPGTIDDQPSVAWNSAGVYAALGDNDRAFELLEQAYRGRKSQVMTLAVNPRFDPLREDPRFDEFLERVGLPRVDGD